MEKVSLKDIAQACGVSVSTVSKALNDREDISSKKKEEIQRIAKELNYVPNFMAYALKSKQTKNIAVLLSENTGTNLMHEYFVSILNSFKDTVEDRGYYITFLNSSYAAGRLSYVEQCRYMSFDGVLLLCADYQTPEVAELLDSEIPIITIDYKSDKHSNIESNQYGDMKKLMQLIYDRGHRKIAYIHGEHSEVTNKRCSAYEDFMMQKQLQVRKEYLYTCPYRDYEKAAAITKSVLMLPERPTCIIYPDDLTAVSGLNLMQEMGLIIPQDISVAGYDGLRVADIMRPRLTTLRQDTMSIGMQAGTKLVQKIEFPESEQETIVVDGMVMPGETV